jgi:hypothetical protein
MHQVHLPAIRRHVTYGPGHAVGRAAIDVSAALDPDIRTVTDVVAGYG